MSTPKSNPTAEEYRRALIKGADLEEAHADALAIIGDHLEREGFGELAVAVREVGRQHRAQVLKHRAIAGAINIGPVE